MIGGLQGENGDLDIKYLKQKNLKMSVVNIGKHSREFRNVKDTISQPKADFATILLWFRSPWNWPLAWCDRLPMALTPSFQLRIAYCLKHWIFDFPSIEMTYSIHNLRSRKCSKSGWQFLSSWMLHVRFLSLLSLLAFMICLWQRTIKLQRFGSSCFWAFHCFAMDSKELSSISDCFGDQITNKNTKTYTIW